MSSVCNIYKHMMTGYHSFDNTIWLKLTETVIQGFTSVIRMALSDKFCLTWNDFKDSLASTVGSLRNGEDFSDVTLVCEDTKIQAHRLVLTASSPFFNLVLKMMDHPKPMGDEGEGHGGHPGLHLQGRGYCS